MVFEYFDKEDFEVIEHKGPYLSKKDIYKDCLVCVKIHTDWYAIKEQYYDLSSDLEKSGYIIRSVTGILNNFRAHFEFEEYSGGIQVLDDDMQVVSVILAHETGPEIFLAAGALIGAITTQAISGIIGNRADAVFVKFARWIMRVFINGLTRRENESVWDSNWMVCLRRHTGHEINLGHVTDLFARFEKKEVLLLKELEVTERVIRRLEKLKIKTSEERSNLSRALSKRLQVKHNLRSMRGRMLKAIEHLVEVEKNLDNL